MKKSIKLAAALAVAFLVQAAPQSYYLKNGDKVSGYIIRETEDSLFVKTTYGSMAFSKSELTGVIPVEKPKESIPAVPGIKYNQEGRWMTIYTGMGMGSLLYGWGVPHVLGIDNSTTANGIRFLLVSGGFYTSYQLTKHADIAMARWNFQTTGALLGAASAIPLMAVVGFENWTNFDTNGKIITTYLMGSTPYGLYLADRLYKKWDVTNGQASMISGSVAYGAINMIGLISILHGENTAWTEGRWRAYSLLTYGSALAAGYYGHQYVSDKSYTEDDAVFINISASVGLVNSMLLIDLLELDARQPVVLTLLAGLDGFTYLADQMSKNVDLDRGQGRIIALGSYAGYLAWLGSAMLFNVDYSTKVCRVVDIASVTTGWYLTFKKVTESDRFKSDKGPAISLSPLLNVDEYHMQPGIGLNIQF